jgi:hypothetical protein
VTRTLGEEGVDWICGMWLAESDEAKALLAAHLLVREAGQTGSIGVTGPTGPTGMTGERSIPPWVQKARAQQQQQQRRVDARGCR